MSAYSDSSTQSEPDGNHRILCRFIQVWASANGDVVAFLECYFDESGSDDGSSALCVAGYLFEQQQCKELDLKWKHILDRFRLPFFRMSSCAHGNWPFDQLSRDERIAAEKEMISLINDHALLGVAVAVNEADYNQWFGQSSALGDAYTFCCWQILAGVQSWISRNNFSGEISYFFEAGHDSQARANDLMNRIFKNPDLRAAYRYAGHGFVKKEIRPVQAADILAWHQATQVKRWLKKNPEMRADFKALAGRPAHELLIVNRKNAAGLIAYHRRLRNLPIRDGVTGHFGGMWFWCPFDGDLPFSRGRPF